MAKKVSREKIRELTFLCTFFTNTKVGARMTHYFRKSFCVVQNARLDLNKHAILELIAPPTGRTDHLVVIVVRIFDLIICSVFTEIDTAYHPTQSERLNIAIQGDKINVLSTFQFLFYVFNTKRSSVSGKYLEHAHTRLGDTKFC